MRRHAGSARLADREAAAGDEGGERDKAARGARGDQGVDGDALLADGHVPEVIVFNLVCVFPDKPKELVRVHDSDFWHDALFQLFRFQHNQGKLKPRFASSNKASKEKEDPDRMMAIDQLALSLVCAL